ncbi:MAG TPA: enoyl-CoA hydratase-related protein [Clostridia bacterium]|nr:enoyl-CoA hydratase-related protein [Clostridia bacterium]
MSYETIIVEKKDHIGTIMLNRPEQLNTFSSNLAMDLNKALNELENDEDTRVVVIKGNGKAFCAGIDVSELEGKTALEYYEWIKLMEEMSLIIAKMGKPVIASVQDLAVANGIGIVASADLAVAAEGARFGATAVNVGLFCMGPAVPLSRNVGRKKALELVLTGDMIDAAEAYRIGLVNKVVPKEELEGETMKLAGKLAAKSPLAVQLGKKSFYKMSDLEYEKALELSNNHFSILCTTEDAHEGVDAFLNKRKPEWKLK